MMGTIDSKQAKEAQRKYCEENGIPLFAPEDGYCFRCRRDIYSRITVEEASKKLITYCPYCNASFVD